MIIYLVVFSISSFLIYISEKIESKFLQRILVVVAILIPSILAGLRASSIGTDVEVYAIRHFERAKISDSFLSFLSRVGTLEVIYYLVVYICSSFFNDYHWLLFFLELLTILFMYLGVVKCHKCFGTSKWLAMLLFYLMNYNLSLNAMRQCLAISVLFYSSTFIFESKYIKHYILLFLSVGFHTSAIFGIIVLPVYLIVKEGRGVTLQKQIFQCLLLLFISIGGTYIAYNTVLRMIEKGFFRKNYLRYLGLGTNEEGFFSGPIVLVYAVFVLAILVHYQYMKNKTKEWLFFMVITVGLLVSKFGMVISTYLPRIGYYFIPLMIVGLTNTRFSYSKKSAKIWDFAIIMYNLIVWYFINVYLGSNETVPYEIYNPNKF